MKTANEVDVIMQTIPAEYRLRWCGGESGPCACMGCVQVANRIVMYEETYRRRFRGDAEHIDERDIPVNIYEKYKITKEEWLAWKASKDRAALSRVLGQPQ